MNSRTICKTLSICCLCTVITAFICLAAFAQQDRVEMTGTVTYPDGRPAAGAKVDYCTDKCCSNKALTTDEQGHFKLTANPGSYYFDVTIGDYVGTGRANVSSDGNIVLQPDIKLQFACLVLGEVTDAKTGLPIDDARIDVCGAYGSRAKTDAQGTFKVHVLPVDGLELDVQKSGYVTNRTNFTAEDKDTIAFRIALKTGGTIKGRVTDQDGKPIPGLQVSARENGVHAVCGKTDADGQYVLKSINTAVETDVYTFLDNCTVQSQKTAKFAPGSTEATVDLTVTRLKPRNITGKVTDTGGAPIANATVFFGTSTCSSAKAETTTNENGEYEIKDVNPQANVLLIKHTGFAPEFLAVEPDKDLRIDAQLGKPHFAKGKVVDASGKPISGVSISVNIRTPVVGRLYDTNHITNADIYYWLTSGISTDSNGLFNLQDLPVGGVVLGIYYDDYAAPNNTPIRVDANDNVIVMHGKPMLAGTVLDAATGKPIDRFQVKWNMNYIGGKNPDSMFDTNDGKFKVHIDDNRFLDQTEYEVRVWAKGYLVEQKTIKTTESPYADYSNVFKLKKTFPIIGKITDTKGTGIENADITVVDKCGLERYGTSPNEDAYITKTITDADGCFKIDEAPSQIGIVIVEKSGYPKLVKKNVDVSKPINISMQAPASLEVDAKGLDEDANRVYLSAMDDTFQSADTVQNGKVVFSALASGTYRMQITVARRTFMRQITLKPGEHMVFNADEPRPVKIHGRVTRRNMPVMGVGVSLSRNEDSCSCTTDSNGEYDISVQETGPAALNWYESLPEGRSRCDYMRVTLSSGDKEFNIVLPAGSISGKVVDAETGAPLVGKKVQALLRSHLPNRNYNNQEPRNLFCDIVSSSQTGNDGTFSLDGVRSGDVVLSVGEPGTRSPEFTGSPMKMTKDGSIGSQVLRVDKLGSLSLLVLDSASGKAFTRWTGALISEDGVCVSYFGGELPMLPVQPGDYTLWILPSDNCHTRVSTKLKILSGKTAKVQIKVPKSRQNIVFRVAANSKFSKLDWSPKDRDWSQSPTKQKSGAWIGYSIRDAKTGKMVISGPQGLEWGGKVERRQPTDPLAIPIQPGTYIIDAVMRDTYDYSVSSKSNLWHISKKLVVKRGNDAIVSIK